MVSVIEVTSDCPNAWWNGAWASFCEDTDTVDIVAHEFGHAYTGAAAGQ